MSISGIKAAYGVALAAMVAGSSGPTFAQSATPSSRISAAQENFASLSPEEQAAFRRWLASGSSKGTRHAPAARSVAHNPLIAAPAAVTVAQQPRSLDRVPILSKRSEAPDNLFSGCSGFVPLLRKDWADVGFTLGGCPSPVDEAAGAEVSYSNDRAKGNAIWSVNGTAALLYNSRTNFGFVGTGGYVTVNRVANSLLSEADSNANSIAYGGVLDFGLNPIGGDQFYFANYFRLRGGVVQDFIKGTDAASFTFEWVPVLVTDFIHIHDGFQPFGSALPLIFRVDPSLLVQYSRLVGGAKPLAFNDMNEALRVGPQVRLGIYPGTSEFFSHFFGSVTYHWAYETYSGRGLSWFDASLTYNIDKDGHFGITGSYQKGNDENTGRLTDIYKISLTGKI
jgi:hypothetical protein